MKINVLYKKEYLICSSLFSALEGDPSFNKPLKITHDSRGIYIIKF